MRHGRNSMSIEDIRAHAHSGHWSDDDWAAALHNANTEVEQLIGERDAAWAAKDKEAVKAIDAEAALAKSDLQIKSFERRLSEAVNARCSCGGAGPGEGCDWCDLYHHVKGAEKQKQETCIDCGKLITSGNICMPCVRVRYPSGGDRTQRR